MADLAFKVAARRRDPITFTLEGDEHEFVFTPPKQAAMVMPVMQSSSDIDAARAAFGWLDKGLSQEDQDRITKRLMDPEDDLDIDAVETIVEGLIEAVSGRPTT
jgi:hypothetical protein